MKKLKITKENVHNHVDQFNLHNLVHNRVPLKDKGWTDISIDEDFFNESINDIAELVGGRAKTKEIVRFNLRNKPVSNWFTNRIVLTPKNVWTYIVGQDYTAEMKEIRKQLKQL
jgi:hypothetical protein